MIGQARVNILTPPGCNGSWGNPLAAVFGFAVYTLDGNPFTLLSVDAVIQHANNTITSEHVWDPGVGFDPLWAGPGSSWVSPAMVMDRVAVFVDGDTVRFTVKVEDDAAVDSYMSWICGIGDPPGSGVMPAVGGTVRAPGGRICEVESIEGLPGWARYVCRPTDRTQCGRLHLVASQLEAVGPRDNLDAAISATE